MVQTVHRIAQEREKWKKNNNKPNGQHAKVNFMKSKVKTTATQQKDDDTSIEDGNVDYTLQKTTV